MHYKYAIMEQEKWKSIKGYEGRYEISSHGRVKALKRTEFMPWYNSERVWKEKILSPNKKDNVYLFVVLYDGTGKKNWKQKYVHRLVADAFKGPLLKGFVVNHLDGDRTNNNENNLEIVRQRDNCLHALSGRKKSSKYHGVHLEARTGNWKAMARNGGKKVYLGKFDNEEDAAMAYREYVNKIDKGLKYLLNQ